MIQTAHHWFDSRRQLVYRPVHRLTEVLCSFSLRLPIKYPTDLRAVEPDPGVFLLIDRGLLVKDEPEVRCRAE